MIFPEPGILAQFLRRFLLRHYGDSFGPSGANNYGYKYFQRI